MIIKRTYNNGWKFKLYMLDLKEGDKKRGLSCAEGKHFLSKEMKGGIKEDE